MKISLYSTQAVMRVGECGVRCVGVFLALDLAESLLCRPPTGAAARSPCHASIDPVCYQKISHSIRIPVIPFFLLPTHIMLIRRLGLASPRPATRIAEMWKTSSRALSPQPMAHLD